MNKKVKSLNEDQLFDMAWANDWQIVEQTQKLLELLKEQTTVKDWKHYKKLLRVSIDGVIDEVQDLIDKKYNIIGAQMILDEVGK